ncbi:MAG: hypothetical protein I8H71_05000 [Xanthomonadaceae bacterium]|nr:hypothetical protein [Xanthomonadaceae bacterium]
MIETTYLRLNKAAEILGTDEDSLLIAATENRVCLHWLLNRIVHAERGFYDELLDPQPDEPPYFWIPEEFAIKHFMYIPLSTMEAAELLKGSSTMARASTLSEQTGPSGSYWIPQTGWATEGGGLTEDDLRVSRNDVFVKHSDVEKIKTQGAAILEQPTNNAPPIHGRDHISDKLATMNQAAVKFWGNADRHDRGTHPDNATVASWLEKHRFSPTLADKAATIIRPEWVPTGRKPEE